MFKTQPLPAGFMFVGIIGMIIFGTRLSFGIGNQTWGFLMLLMSLIVFISAVISITPEIPKVKDLEFSREVKKLKKDYGLAPRKRKKG